jgi:hypothetical protein
MKSTPTTLLILAALATPLLASSATRAQMLGPTPYLSRADSPFNLSGLGTTFFLEDFEDGMLNVPGITVTPMSFSICGCGGLTDSVDGDDGVIDGSGAAGHSLFTGDGSTGITVTFFAEPFGRLPTRAGIVWTDGAGQINFEAYDADGVLIGTLQGDHADGSYNGTTAEDRFYGVIHEAGISRIHLSNTGGGIEVDHIQYGLATCRPDLNADGAVNVQDFLLYLAAFAAADPRADFTGDGSITISDFLAFLSAYASGC